MNHNNWITMPLNEIIREYGEGEPLDGDDVDDLIEVLKLKANFHQGNITEEEYYKAIEVLPVRVLLGQKH